MRVSSLLLLLLALPVLAGAEPLPVAVTPSRVVLGQVKTVRVRVALPPEAPPLRAAASTGQLRPLPSPSPGSAEYEWTLPDIRYPLLGVLAFWTEPVEGPPEVTPVFIPLLAANTVDVRTSVGAQVTVQVADTIFGPVRTNKKGLARVPVEVPPGVREASVVVTQKRKQKLSKTRIELPPPSALLALISPEAVPPGGPGWLLVFGEQRMTGPELNLRVRGGGVEESSPGLFRLVPEAGAKQLLVEARRRDGSGLAQVVAPVAARFPILVPLPPLALLWKKPPATVAPPVKALPPVVEDAPSGLHLFFTLRGGGYLAGGDSRGPLASVDVGAILPPLGGRLSLEAEAGVRRCVSHPRVEPLGSLEARVVALPLLLAVGVRALEWGPLAVHGRLGGGVMYYDHRATSPFFDPPLSARGRVPMGFIAGQLSWSLGALSVLLEVRGSYAPVNSALIDAQLGGLSASLGARYVL